MKIYNMVIQLQIVGQLVTTFDFYAIKMGESKHIEQKTENSTVNEGDCEVSLRSLSQQPPIKYVNCDRLQPRIEPVT